MKGRVQVGIAVDPAKHVWHSEEASTVNDVESKRQERDSGKREQESRSGRKTLSLL